MGGRATAPMESWPFVARDEESAAVEAALAAGRGSVVVGDAGVGKSRLLATIADRAEATGWRVHRVAATRSLATVPFGAFAPTLTTTIAAAGGNRLDIVQRALAELGGDPEVPVLVAIDDAQHLDDGSAALAALAARSGLVVVATLRRGESCPDAVTSLWKDELALRFDLAPLDSDGVGEVLEAALAGPVDSGTRYRLVDRSGGNLLFLRELIRVGIARGSLVERGGVWMWDGPIIEAPAVTDLVRSRMLGLDADERHVVEIVALSEPIGVEILDALCNPAAVRTTEARGIIVTERSAARLDARLEHPLYADVVSDGMTAVHAADVARTIADCLLGRGARRVGDRLRAASLLLRASSSADVELLLFASVEARALGDFDLAERFGRAAFDARGGAAAAVDLAETLYWQNRYDELIALLSSGVLDSARPDLAALGANHVASSFFWGRGELEEAEAWIERGITLAGPEWESDLRGQHVQMLMFAGRGREAIAEGVGVLAMPTVTPAAEIRVYSGMLPSLADTGQLSEIDRHVPRALALIAEAPGSINYAAGGTLVAMFVTALFRGQLPELEPMLAAFDDEAVRRIDDPFRGVWVFLRGRSALAQGRMAVAVPMLREAAAVCRRRDPGGILPWCLVSLAQALGAYGDARGARDALTEYDAVRLGVMGNIEVDAGLGRAWAAAAGGERSEGALIATETGRMLVERGKDAVAALALHDAVRLGAPARTIARELGGPRSRAEGPVVAAWARHVDAIANDDLDELFAVAADFASLSMPLLAAEAAAGATRVAASAGLRARQAEASARAAAYATECGPVLTPLLETLTGRAALASLTRREQEVALMAARGTSKRLIGEQLGVSIRTVGNHINHVYGKLGISSREELRAILSIGPTAMISDAT